MLTHAFFFSLLSVKKTVFKKFQIFSVFGQGQRGNNNVSV